VTARLEGQLTLERLERTVLVAAREVHETTQPVQRDAAEA
jgi:hypothetical protein